MSDPKVTIQVAQRGAKQTAAEVEKVAEAQDKNTRATERAGKAAEKAAAQLSRQADAIERLRSAESSRQAAAARLAAAQQKQASAAAQAAQRQQALAEAAAQAAARLASAGRDTAAAAAAASAGAAKGASGLAKLGRAAERTWGAMRFLANLLPNFGIGGFVIIAIAGFKALRDATNSAAKAAETYTRVMKAAEVQTSAYVAILEKNRNITREMLSLEAGMTREVRAATQARGKWNAAVDEANDRIRGINEQIVDLREQERRTGRGIGLELRRLEDERERAANARFFALLKLDDAEARHRQAIERSQRAEQERTNATYRFRDSIVSLADSLTGGPGSLYTALYDVQRIGNKAFSDLKAGIDKATQPSKRRGGAGAAMARRSRQAGRDAAIDAQLAAMDLEYEGAEAQARGRTAPQAPPTNQMAEFFATVSSGAGEAMQAVSAYGASLTEAAMKAEAQRKAQVAMTEAMTASAQSYASAALSAALYGGSVSEAINATARAAFVEGTVGALGALAKAAVFSIINPPGVAPMLAAAKMYAAQAAVAGAIAAGTGGIAGGGGGGGGSTAITEPTPADFGEPERRERQDSEMFINFASGQSGRPVSRADAGAIVGALVDLARSGGYRLEARRA